MILLYTKERDEFVDRVIDWLPRTDLIRICKFNDFTFRPPLKNQAHLAISNKFVGIKRIRNISSVWFHGGDVYVGNLQQSSELNTYLSASTKIIFESYLKRSNLLSIGSLLNNEVNKKIENLYNAQFVLLKTPATIFTNRKSELMLFFKKFKQTGVICKNFMEGNIFIEGDFVYDTSKTFEITSKLIEEIPKNFGISLFQEKIDKKFEIRIVFFDGVFYSAALIDTKKHVDIRIALNSSEKPRMVPYKLPEPIKVKLKKLMHKSNYSYCSIDLIYTHNGEYIFLEINPCGQISFINEACNFYMEKDFADYLIKK